MILAVALQSIDMNIKLIVQRIGGKIKYTEENQDIMRNTFYFFKMKIQSYGNQYSLTLFLKELAKYFIQTLYVLFFKENVLKIVPMMIVFAQRRRNWLIFTPILTNFVIQNQNFYCRKKKNITMKQYNDNAVLNKNQLT